MYGEFPHPVERDQVAVEHFQGWIDWASEQNVCLDFNPSYFAHPNDVLGAFGAPVASEVTPEGYIFTGFGELMFLIGNPPRPTWQRHRTLLEGFLPAVEYGIEQDGIRYEWLMFAADLGESLSGIPVNFIRVTVHNCASEERAAYFSTAWRFRGDVNTAYTDLFMYVVGPLTLIYLAWEMRTFSKAENLRLAAALIFIFFSIFFFFNFTKNFSTNKFNFKSVLIGN